MSNMSYCRFENTVRDLNDCAANLRDEEVSSAEKEARRTLIEICYDILEEVGVQIETDEHDLSRLIDELDDDDGASQSEKIAYSNPHA